MVTNGSVTVKLAPPKSTRYLFLKNNYENFEFVSPVNPWKVQPEYVSEFNKVKCIECTLSVGKTLFIPPYWWYSIQLNEESSISVLKYRTYMNNVTLFPYLLRQFLQQQNVRLNISRAIHQNNVGNIDGEMQYQMEYKGQPRNFGVKIKTYEIRKNARR